MSYARFGEDSSVYVFGNTAGYFECCACCIATARTRSKHLPLLRAIRDRG